MPMLRRPVEPISSCRHGLMPLKAHAGFTVTDEARGSKVYAFASHPGNSNTIRYGQFNTSSSMKLWMLT